MAGVFPVKIAAKDSLSFKKEWAVWTKLQGKDLFLQSKKSKWKYSFEQSIKLFSYGRLIMLWYRSSSSNWYLLIPQL